MFSYKYIKQNSLHNLDLYAYNSKDRSLFAQYVMQPFWNAASKLLPLWLAPNLVTLIGFGAMFMSYLVSAYYSPNLDQSLPRWVYFFNAFCLFFYQTFDALDGKQARRTKTSSPLGELFDHGCDAMTTVFCVFITASSLEVGAGTLVYGNLIILMATFFLSQWDAYYNGVLDLWYINVTEAQIFGMIAQMIPFFFGPDFWRQTFFVGSLKVSYGYLMIIPSTVVCLGFGLSSIWNVYVYLSKQPDEKKQSQLYQVIESVQPCLWLSILYSLWAYSSPYLLKENVHAFGLCLGFLYSNLVGKLVMCRVCKLKYHLIHYNLIPLPFALLNSLLGGVLFNEQYFLYFYCALAILSYFHFALCLIEQMTIYLKIKCLTIPYPPPADNPVNLMPVLSPAKKTI